MSARQLAGSSGLSDQAVLSKLLKRKVRSNSSISSRDGTNEKKRANSNNSVIKTTPKNPNQKQTYVNSHNLPNSTNTEMNNSIIENNNSTTHIIESILEHDANNTGVPENVVQSSNATNTPTTINSIPNIPVSNREVTEHLPPEAEHDRLTYTVPISQKLHNMTYAQATCTKTTYYNTTPQFTTAQTTSVTPHYAISHNIAPHHTTQISNPKTSNESLHYVIPHNIIPHHIAPQITNPQTSNISPHSVMPHNSIPHHTIPQTIDPRTSNISPQYSTPHTTSITPQHSINQTRIIPDRPKNGSSEITVRKQGLIYTGSLSDKIKPDRESPWKIGRLKSRSAEET
ncbi:unnamed protein product [Nezara viridula]|uniref:Uncharacterized protein n=1 Tax=Nezara viridula TaxID=85310 RepID=A0A9P0MRP6_NEZVI|nr:unnamed protein product [Nezara viridula]